MVIIAKIMIIDGTDRSPLSALLTAAATLSEGGGAFKSTQRIPI
jgi:hypothetical protein